jgi:Apoptosis inhibitory protein 5 (API5)
MDPASQALYAAATVFDRALTPAESAQHAEDFESIVTNAKLASTASAKRLAGDLIPKYIGLFGERADLVESGVSVLFDLCEAEELEVRLQAIRGFARVAVALESVRDRLTDVLVQLLQADDKTEQAEVSKALLAMARLQPMSVMETLLSTAVVPGEGAAPARRCLVRCIPQVKRSLEKESLPALFTTVAESLLPALQTAPTIGDANECGRILHAARAGQAAELEPTAAEIDDALLEAAARIVGQPAAAGEFPTAEDVSRVVECWTTISAPLAKRDLVEVIPTQLLYSQLFVSALSPAVRLCSGMWSDESEEREFLSAVERSKLLRAIVDFSKTAKADDARTLLPSISAAVVFLANSGSPAGKSSQISTAKPSQHFFQVLEMLLLAFRGLGKVAPGALSTVGVVVNTGQPGDMIESDAAAKRLEVWSNAVSRLQSACSARLKSEQKGSAGAGAVENVATMLRLVSGQGGQVNLNTDVSPSWMSAKARSGSEPAKKGPKPQQQQQQQKKQQQQQQKKQTPAPKQNGAQKRKQQGGNASKAETKPRAQKRQRN